MKNINEEIDRGDQKREPSFIVGDWVCNCSFAPECCNHDSLLAMIHLSYWRSECAPIVAAVLEATKGQDDKAITKSLRKAYPFSEREHHPYKIWLDEIKVQRGFKIRYKPGQDKPDLGQRKLF